MAGRRFARTVWEVCATDSGRVAGRGRRRICRRRRVQRVQELLHLCVPRGALRLLVCAILALASRRPSLHGQRRVVGTDHQTQSYSRACTGDWGTRVHVGQQPAVRRRYAAGRPLRAVRPRAGACATARFAAAEQEPRANQATAAPARLEAGAAQRRAGAVHAPAADGRLEPRETAAAGGSALASRAARFEVLARAAPSERCRVAAAAAAQRRLTCAGARRDIAPVQSAPRSRDSHAWPRPPRPPRGHTMPSAGSCATRASTRASRSPGWRSGAT
eukprot:4718605-Prymnesium_polylepis.1